VKTLRLQLGRATGRRRRLWWLRMPPLALAVLTLAGPAAAARVRIVGVDTAGYPNLRATVVAPVGAGQPRLFENGAPVANLDAVNMGRAKSVVLAVDRSQSMTGRALRDAVAAARAFVATKGAADRVEVIAFGREAVSLTGFSSSPADSDSALRHLVADRKAGTALWDAIALGTQRLAGEGSRGHVIIVLTDGHDVSSADSFSAAVAAAHRAKVTVYPIGIAGPDFTPGPLARLADETGGTYHQASSSAQLASVYTSIGRVLTHTWELRYPTTARPGDKLELTARVPGAGTGTRAIALPGSPAGGPARIWTAAWAPFAVSLLVGFLVLLACAFWFAAREGVWVQERLRPHLTQMRRVTKTHRKRARRELLQNIFTSTERAFANVKQFRALQRLLERADLPLRAAELLYICIGAALTAGLLAAAAVHSLLVTAVFMLIAGSLPVLFIRFKANARVKAFDNQLPDLLITISASLKAGHSFRHAIQAVVDEGAQPTAKEFSRVLTQTQFGRPLDDGLAEMSERVGSKNLAFVINAVTIQRQVGGALAGLFDMVAETVRQRQQFARKVRGLTAMGRMSAYVLTGLPIFIALSVTALNPAYMAPLYNTSTGHELVGLGLAMMTVGALILKKMVSFRG
jgi:tight adherence protein B